VQDVFVLNGPFMTSGGFTAAGARPREMKGPFIASFAVKGPFISREGSWSSRDLTRGKLVEPRE
ncbi:hypothetical protein, partial [Amycolatopsis sp. NPDC057786]|uniref:hypothetical protein n=1 Tax=Amycolatopsis sp. NPDC057786 TaxID=3346250 RepID=UPI003670F00C